MPPKKVFRKNNGFSLPEIIIVLLVILIIAIFAVPQMTSSMQLNRVNTAASTVASVLSEAKTTAVKQNSRVSFVLDETNNLVWLESNSTIIGTVKKLPQGTKIKIAPDTTAVQEKITFNSTGNLVTQPATVSVYNSQKRAEKKVSVNLTGTISVANMNTY